jgi:hypothetical protein
VPAELARQVAISIGASQARTISLIHTKDPVS